MAGEQSKIIFKASLPPIQSAIQLDGQGDGGRIKLDVSRQDVEALLKLQKLTGKRLIVYIVEDKSPEKIDIRL